MEWGKCYLIADCTIPELNMYIHTEMVLNTHTHSARGGDGRVRGGAGHCLHLTHAHTPHKHTSSKDKMVT